MVYHFHKKSEQWARCFSGVWHSRSSSMCLAQWLKPLLIYETWHIATQYWNSAYVGELAKIYSILPHIKYKLTSYQLCMVEPHSCSPMWTRSSHHCQFIYFSLEVHGTKKYHLYMLEALHLDFIIKVAWTKNFLGLGFHLYIALIVISNINFKFFIMGGGLE